MLKASKQHMVAERDQDIETQEASVIHHRNVSTFGHTTTSENNQSGDSGSPPFSCSTIPSLFSRHSPNTIMGNVASSAASCGSGMESKKTGALTSATSQEELSQYAMAQEFLEQAKSKDEASNVSKMSHSDSLGTLSSAPSSPNGNAKPRSRGSSTGSSPSENKRRSSRGFSRNGSNVLDRVASAFQAAGSAVGSKFNEVEDFMFPHTPHVGSSSIRGNTPTLSVTPKVRGGVLLRGCTDDEEHKQLVRQSISIMKEMKGEAGLKAMGYKYRSVPIDHGNDRQGESIQGGLPGLTEADHRKDSEEDETTTTAESSSDEFDSLNTMTRLFHAESDTMITMKNRREFIADGDMYDQVARLCQEYAQEVMIREGNLEWVTLCKAGNNAEPICALVSKAISDDEANLDKMPTLLIATGKGKVRAGIFSRQHLLLSGMECSTAIPIVREAKKRKMNVVMLDPNVHGDRLGMVTFEKSMARLFRRWESDEIVSSSDQPPLANRDLYVLSHSQSGAQFARYLLEKSNHYVPHIRAVAFTDSTHNIQWARDNKDLHQLLQSDNCVYFKCAKDSQKGVLAPLETTGQDVETDHFWEHRFGRIQTKCAGTAEHSLTNWFAHYHIWNHFDHFLRGNSKEEVKDELSLSDPISS